MPQDTKPKKDVVIRVPRLLPPPEEQPEQPTAGSSTAAEKEGEDPEERRPFLPNTSKLPSDPKQASAIKACASAAEWNSLLIWARGQRGPQWDAGTGMWVLLL
jgi:hypothetical protein